jgi:hypothetical protein
MSGRAWSLLAVTGRRQYAGNTGYADDPASVYRYDSTVGNSRHISIGDLAIVRGRAGLIGMGLISRIHARQDEKQRFRCPICNTTAIKQRTRSSDYRCASNHTFDKPRAETIGITRYEAEYEGTWQPLNGVMSASALGAVTIGAGTQNSIREVDAVKFAGHIVALRPDTAVLLSQYLQGLAPELVDEDQEDAEDDFVPSFEDRRVMILRAIRARRGQSKFRNGLIGKHGARCMISDCPTMEIVEAAHIWPYRGEADNALTNGLLLRSDLHTLYDLDLIGIDPNLNVHVAPALKNTAYAGFAGKIIAWVSSRPNDEAIGLRWKAFLSASVKT